MPDTFDLERFIDAQNSIFDTVLAELRSGKKETHWMWFIFPQIAGLGKSPTAIKYAIKSLGEAKSYLNHPVLGKRLLLATETVISIGDKTAFEIFGSPDDLKFKSCMTLFDAAQNDLKIFSNVIDWYFVGNRDAKTLEKLQLST